MKSEYEERLKIPLEGNNGQFFYSKTGILIAVGYIRIVIGERGPYIEFEREHIRWSIVKKLMVEHYYFDEYRTIEDKIMIYFQKKKVDYADYKLRKYYISPFLLNLPKDVPIIVELKDEGKVGWSDDTFSISS